MNAKDDVKEKFEKFLAHRINDGLEESIKKHSEKTGNLASQFAAKFGAEEFGRQCGEIHDIGKYSDAFQRRIRGENIRVDHSTFGARELIRKGDEISAFCVAGHHTGLPDGGSSVVDTATDKTFYGRMKRNVPDASLYKEEFTINKLMEPSFFKNDTFTKSFFIRMLFSCLVDADYLETEIFVNGKNKNKLRGVYPDLTTLNKKLAKYIADNGFGNTDVKNKLDQIRAEVLHECQKKALLAPGIFTLSAPTGAGKTISSLAFALAHAKKFGKERIIYVAPYKTIIDQTADVFEGIFENMNAVLAHHSGADYDISDEAEKDENFIFDKQIIKMKKLAAENWDMPIIVTTAVQFFESLYDNRPSKCRKIHNIANSVVVLDEGQALPLSFLKPCMEAIKQLVSHYQTTVLFMSATQPAFDHLLTDKDGLPLKRTEVIPDILSITKGLARTTFCDLGKLELSKLVDRLKKHKQFLCIVNLRESGRKLLDELKNDQQVYLLTTLMTYIDRKKALAEISKKLENGEPCWVIATSLIEAGVDIDFPTVYREKSGLDSLIQAAGRCNRKNTRAKEDSIVYYFSGEHDSKNIFSINIGAMEDALEEGLEEKRGIEDPETIKTYFEYLYAYMDDHLLDRMGIIKAFDERYAECYMPFRTVSKKFQMIPDKEATVYIPYTDNQSLIAKALAGTASRDDFRKLGRYSVSVPKFIIQTIKGKDKKTPLTSIGENSFILQDESLYDKTHGLKI